MPHIPTHGVLPSEEDGSMPDRVPTPRPGIFDRLLGLQSANPDARRAGLLALGAGLLQQSGFRSERDRPTLGEAFGRALPGAQEAARAAAQTQLALDPGADFESIVRQLLSVGDTESALRVAQTAKALREQEATRSLSFQKLNDGSLAAFDPVTGEMVKRYPADLVEGLEPQQVTSLNAAILAYRTQLEASGINDQATAFRTFQSQVDAAKPTELGGPGNSVAQHGLVVSVLSMQNPRIRLTGDSVADAAAAERTLTGIPRRVFLSVFRGERLTETDYKQLVSAANGIARSIRQEENRLREQFRGLARRSFRLPSDIDPTFSVFGETTTESDPLIKGDSLDAHLPGRGRGGRR